MADTSLANYFTISPSSTTWGLGQNALAQALPILMQGRGTTNQQFGTALGMSLVSALLGYQARRSAADQSLQAAEIGSQMLGLATPQERLNLIKGVDSSNIQQSLLGLNARIGEQELTNQLIQRKVLSDLGVRADFELGPTGRKLAEQALAVKRAEEAGIPLSQIETLDTNRSKLGAALFGSPVEPVNVTDAATLLTDPTMLQTMSKPQKEALAAQAKLTGERQTQIDDLRKQFTALPEVKNFSLIDNAARIVAKAVQDPSAVATQELVRRAVQLIEPGMAVREGEQAAIAASQSIPDQFKGQLQTAITGQGGLQADVREGILRIAQRAYEAQAERYKTTKSFYENIAKERKLPEKQVSYLGEAQPWESLIKTPEAVDKTSQLQAILKELTTTANPARIAELKQQAAAIYKGQ
jgi:hypothetical protein